MNAPLLPPNPAAGGQNWQWDGSRWVCCAAVGTVVITKVFTASAPYTPSPGLQSLVVETIGGGGGGGWTASGLMALGENLWAGGGGSGGYSRKTLAAPMVAGGVNVTVGAGGLGATYTSASTDGGATSFGALCVANGGYAASSTLPEPGQSCPPGVGDVAFPGAGGLPGGWSFFPATASFISVANSMGGQPFGGQQATMVGPGSVLSGAAGPPGTGAGGGGALTAQPQTGALIDSTGNGGNGGSGLCIVTEYCWADAIDDGCGCGPTGQARVAFPQGRGAWGYEDGDD